MAFVYEYLMLTLQQAHSIGQNWVEKWNENHLTAYCSLYDENAEELSSLANRLIRISNGHIKGKNILFCYWQLLRAVFPDNKYELKNVHVDNDDVIVYFTMNGLNTNAIAKMSINEQQKIERILICHV